MKKLLVILLLLVCLPSFGQRLVEEVSSIAALKNRPVGSINQTIFVRGYNAPDDGGGGYVIITNSVIGVDNVFRFVSSNNAAYSYERQFSGPADMRWGGAVANGTTDVTALIQATINAAATKGYALYVATPRGGKFRITGAVTLPNNTTLVGDGLSSEFYLNNVDLAFQSSGKTNISISGIRFSGAYSRAVEGLLGNGITVKNCEFYGATRIPASGYIAPVRMDSSSRVKIIENYFHHNGNSNTNFDNSVDILIGGGSSETHDVEISGNRIEGMLTRVSIATFSMASGRILNNFVNQGNSIGLSDNNGYGILVYGTPGATYQNIVSGNTVTNCAGTGIYLRYADGTVVSGNSIVDSGKKQSDNSLPVGGIVVNLSYGAQAINNGITNATKAGINITDSTNVVVAGNILETVPNRAAIELRAMVDNASISGNIVSTALRGIASTVGGGVYKNVTLLGNSISNVTDGIYIENGTNVMVIGNQVHAVTSQGIYNAAGSDALIANNFLVGTGGGTGIRNDGTYVTIAMNTVGSFGALYLNSDTNSLMTTGPRDARQLNVYGNARLGGADYGTQYALEVVKPTYAANQYLLQVGALGASTTPFAITTDGSSNFVHTFNNVNYYYPLTQGTSGSYQVNDGSGNLIWQIGGMYNFGDQFQSYNITNILLADGLNTTNQNLARNVTFRSVHLGSVSGSFDVDASLGVAFTLLLSGDSTLNFTNWTDDHGIQLILTNAGSFSLITTSAYPILWTKTQNATPETNDFGAGVVNTFDFWKTGGRVIAYGKAGYGVTLLGTTDNGGTGTNAFFSQGIVYYNGAQLATDGNGYFQWRANEAFPWLYAKRASSTNLAVMVGLFDGVGASDSYMEIYANKIRTYNADLHLEAFQPTNSVDLMVSGSAGLKLTKDYSVLVGDGTTTTTRTNKMLYIPTFAGPPTGVPHPETGFAALGFDTVNTNLYIYSAGAWNKIRLQ